VRDRRVTFDSPTRRVSKCLDIPLGGTWRKLQATSQLILPRLQKRPTELIEAWQSLGHVDRLSSRMGQGSMLRFGLQQLVKHGLTTLFCEAAVGSPHGCAGWFGGSVIVHSRADDRVLTAAAIAALQLRHLAQAPRSR